jgi:charged multivesicular body protein 6
MSNQDEDEVEDELEALEREMNPIKDEPVSHPELPDAPAQEPERRESQRERWERRAREQRGQQEALLA